LLPVYGIEYHPAIDPAILAEIIREATKEMTGDIRPALEAVQTPERRAASFSPRTGERRTHGAWARPGATGTGQ
jgi:hypothetical protein